MLFDSFSLATAHGDASLPSPRSVPSVASLLAYVDAVFEGIPSDIDTGTALYPAIAWSPHRVHADPSVGQPRPQSPPQFVDPPLRLSSLRLASDNHDSLHARMGALMSEQRSSAGRIRSDVGFVVREIYDLGRSVRLITEPDGAFGGAAGGNVDPEESSVGGPEGIDVTVPEMFDGGNTVS